jgi:prepilin-type N-terminal cleavage/methylation domain-containing protein
MKKGFTLIELLVVIAIIGLLSSVVLASLNTARSKARSAKRVSDLHQMVLALEMYYDANGTYPVVTANTDTGWRSECATYGGIAANSVIPGTPAFVPTYLPSMPSDPSMDSGAQPYSTSCYLYRSNGTDYAILDHASPDIRYESHPELIDPARDSSVSTDYCNVDGTTIWAWKVSSPGGRCW